MIDALDECEREADIRAILQLLARTKDIHPMPLRIVVTSRPELHMLAVCCIPALFYRMCQHSVHLILKPYHRALSCMPFVSHLNTKEDVILLMRSNQDGQT